MGPLFMEHIMIYEGWVVGVPNSNRWRYFDRPTGFFGGYVIFMDLRDGLYRIYPEGRKSIDVTPPPDLTLEELKAWMVAILATS